MAKGKDDTIELDAPGSDKSVTGVDVRAFGEIKGGELGEKTTSRSLLKNLDFQDDQVDEGDNPLEDGAAAKDKPSTRYVLAKLVTLNERNTNTLTVKVNGKKASFPMGRWVFSPYYMVQSAKTSGELSCRNEPKAAVKRLDNNHPRFQIQELPEPWNSPEKIRDFQAKVQAEKGKQIPFACETF